MNDHDTAADASNSPADASNSPADGSNAPADGSNSPADGSNAPADGPAGEREPVTRTRHHNSWSANLEEPRHADDPELIVAEAIDAVEATATGYHVNLVTHGEQGHPKEYLWPELEALVQQDGRGDELECEYVDQCGCGGHVTRVHVE